MDDLKAGKKNIFIDYAGLFFIGSISLGYLLFFRRIAKLHVNLDFIRAPLFTGDMVFIICFFLFILKFLLSPKKNNIFTYLFVFYLGFVIIKTLVGYFYWGPLALRHSVLFCYPLFAVFSFSFYRRDFFQPRRVLLLALILICIFAFSSFYYYFLLTCFTLCLILINVYPGRLIRNIVYCLLLLAVPYKLFFNTSRTFLVSNVFVIMYMSLGFIIVSKIKTVHKLIFCLFLAIFVFYGLAKNTSRREVGSLIGFSEMSKRYNETIEVVRRREPTFVEKKLEVRLYNENRDTFESSLADLKKEAIKLATPVVKNNLPSAVSIVENSVLSGLNVKPENVREPLPPPIVKKPEFYSKPSHPLSGVKKNILYEKRVDDVVLSKEVKKADEIHPPNKSINMSGIKDLFTVSIGALKKPDNIPVTERGADIPYGNSLFRIVIWKDAFNEMFGVRPISGYIFGFDFGKPFRPRTLEILNWAYVEWNRDGWICFHNSYIDIVYRAGIIGILMVILIPVLLLFLVNNSFKRRSLTLMLLSGVLINWFIAANFLEILEMPYTAIPIWSLFGLTFAYLFRNRGI